MRQHLHALALLASLASILGTGCGGATTSTAPASSPLGSGGFRTNRAEGFEYEYPEAFGTTFEDGSYVHLSADETTAVNVGRAGDAVATELAMAETLRRLEEQGASVHLDGTFTESDGQSSRGQAIIAADDAHTFLIIRATAASTYMIVCATSPAHMEETGTMCLQVAASIRETN